MHAADRNSRSFLFLLLVTCSVTLCTLARHRLADVALQCRCDYSTLSLLLVALLFVFLPKVPANFRSPLRFLHPRVGLHTITRIQSVSCFSSRTSTPFSRQTHWWRLAFRSAHLVSRTAEAVVIRDNRSQATGTLDGES